MNKHFILYLAFVGAVMAQTPYDSLYLKSTVYKNMIAQFELTKVVSADVVFLGNSITFGGAWNELLGRERIINRGIGSDNTVGMLHRLHQVYLLQPKLCFIMAGINDLYAGASVNRIFHNYMMIVDTLLLHGIIPVIQSTLHVNPKWKQAVEKNDEVNKLNFLLKDYAKIKQIEWLDINTALSSDGALRNEYTTDGVHLTALAYHRWRELLLPVLKKHGL
ncbi:MAG: GDSL-type esterase/lipase family protein [Bacteroidetes bacterium]|nr:GDSL-type esterase/lipase family protein [Bacteroidota bacterium]